MSMTIHATLCQIIRDGRLLLLLKDPGRFGEGKWNGAGGKLLPGESPEAGVVREVLEETGLTLRSVTLHGVLDFYFGEKPEPDWVVHVFSSSDFSGEPLEASEEGVLRWFRFEEVPYDRMWEDDLYWLPPLLDGKRVRGFFVYDEDGENLLRHSLTAEKP
jgi:8-oxo-dGTP pyrophosphatase MutT (NUDIX family)